MDYGDECDGMQTASCSDCPYYAFTCSGGQYLSGGENYCDHYCGTEGNQLAAIVENAIAREQTATLSEIIQAGAVSSEGTEAKTVIARLNVDRQSIQLSGCNGKTVGNYPMSKSMVAAVSRQLQAEALLQAGIRSAGGGPYIRQ